MSRGRAVTFQPSSNGDLLKECIRAYMHGAMPSALLSRVQAGVTSFLNEQTLTPEDREFMMRFLAAIDAWHQEWREREDDTYR
jgi:hypothetical protein